MATQGRHPERQDCSHRVRTHSRRDHRGDPRRQAAVPTGFRPRQSLAAPSPNGGWGTRQDNTWGRLPEGTTDEDGACADRSRIERLADPGGSPGRAKSGAALPPHAL